MLKYENVTYDNAVYAGLPVLPDYSDSEFIALSWLASYSWTWLADTLYGDIEMAKDLMILNAVVNPFASMENRIIRIPRIDF